MMKQYYLPIEYTEMHKLNKLLKIAKQRPPESNAMLQG